MRIRTQALLAILPLFAGLAAVIGVLSFSAARQEMVWGLEEEVKALSSTIAEFVDGDAMHAAVSPEEHLAKVSLPFQRILAFEQAKQIIVMDSAGAAIWPTPGADAGLPFLTTLTELRPLAATAATGAGGELDTGTARASEPISLANGEQMMMGFAPILTSHGRSVGSISVVVDASRLSALSRAMPANLLRLTAVALAIGTIAALLISALLTRRVRALSRAAGEVARGAYDREIEIGTIQEISDLSNTFNTMTSVLKDVIDRAQRTLVEGEQFRTPIDLARTYSEDDRAELEWERDGVHVAAGSCGRGHPGDFSGVLELAHEIVVYLGRVERDTPLESAIAAGAARRTIHALAQSRSTEELFDRTARWLGARIETARWPVGGSTPILRASYGNSGPEAEHPQSAQRSSSLLMHTFDTADASALDRWALIFAGLPAGELTRNIIRNLDGVAPGTLIAIGRSRRAHDPAGSSPTATRHTDHES